MQFIMNFIYGVKAFFDVLLAVPFFGPALVIEASFCIVAKAVRSR